MSFGSWPSLPPPRCVMQVVSIKADGRMQGCPLAETPSVQGIALRVCVCTCLYTYFNTISKLQQKLKYI